MRMIFRYVAVSLAAFAASGCMSWTPGWQSTPRTAPGDQGATLEEAEALLDQAGDEREVERAIEALRSVERTEANVLDLDTRLAEAHILYGAAYARDRAAKAEHYETGLSYAERAMATNSAFRQRVENGSTIAEASDELGPAEAEAMLLWVTGVSYYFREVLGPFARVLSFRKIAQTQPLLERLMEIDPDLENGSVPFSLAIHYIARPPWAGQDLDRAVEMFDRAMAIEPRSLLVRWGRAKYLHSKTGDLESFRRDLEWVLDQDPREVATPYHWNVYLQRDAREMLDQID